jgi:hypothetical protein
MRGRSATASGGTPHVTHLTRWADRQRPAVCQGCAWWQMREGDRPVDKARWMDDVEDRFGAFGKLYLLGDRHLASLQYGPAGAFPRARDLPAGPPSGDAVLVTCAYLSDRSAPWALQSLFLACLGECRDRGLPAVEAFATAAPLDRRDGVSEHRTIFERDFLGDLGFRPLRQSGPIELMRLETAGLIPAVQSESLLEAAWRRARELVARPAPATLS